MWSRKFILLHTIISVLTICRSTATTASKIEANQENTAQFPSVKAQKQRPTARAKARRSFVQLMTASPMSRVKTNGLAFSCDRLLMTWAPTFPRVHKLKHSRLRVFTQHLHSMVQHGVRAIWDGTWLALADNGVAVCFDSEDHVARYHLGSPVSNNV